MRASTLAVSPSREISPEVGLTHQAPMRSVVGVGRSIGQRVLSSVFEKGSGARELYQPCAGHGGAEHPGRCCGGGATPALR